MKLVLSVVALLLISGFAIVQYDQISLDSSEITANVDELLLDDISNDGFKKAIEVVPINFPEDLGSHPDYRLEWWYYTGNLADADGNRFGFQLTFFRQGLTPGLPDRESEWASNQIYFAHFTVTDETGQTFSFDEKFSRGSPDLANVTAQPYHVWIDDWFAREIAPGQVQLKAQTDEVALDVILEQTKPVTLQGDQGLSSKSNEPGNASYYYSLTNNKTTGTVTTPRGTFAVTGKSWKDHEWSTSALGEEAVGWDWYSIQLEDDREIMFGNIRTTDNSLIDQLYGGSMTLANGDVMKLTRENVSLEVLEYWTSPHTEAVYPSKWRFSIPSEGIDITLTPLLNDQELLLSTTYWEGAIKAEGTHNGYGYIELTGYAHSIAGRL
ncbi:MAG: lipocalin-like domain-containing protein [Chloroflexota bacterium]